MFRIIHSSLLKRGDPMKQIDRLLRYLNENGVRYQLISHLPAFTAHQVAAASHVPDKDLAKTLLLKADDQYWIAVLRADQRLNERMLRSVLDKANVSLAPEEDLEGLFPGCELGAMPPFGSLYGLPVMVDSLLAAEEEIVFNACTHTESIRMRFEDFEGLAKPLVVSFSDSPEFAEGNEPCWWMQISHEQEEVTSNELV
jgi:Ala-tRNA(Pro) deacylase